MSFAKSKPSLGTTDIVFGGGPIGGLYTSVRCVATLRPAHVSITDISNFLQTPRSVGVAAVVAALDAGIVEIDTAPLYGAGQSESYVGAALAAASKDVRDAVRVHTKVGRIVVPVDCDDNRVEKNYTYQDGRDCRLLLDYTADGVRLSLAASRARLGACRVDTVRIHDAETPKRHNDAINGGCVDELVRLRGAHDIACVSLGMNEPKFIAQFLQHYPRGTFDNVLMAGCWNLLDQSGVGVMQMAAKLGVEVHNAGVFASGYLCDQPFYKYSADVDADVKRRADGWRAFCEQRNVPLRAAALAFAFLPAAVTRVVLGMRTADEVRENVALLDAANAIEPQFWRDAQSSGLIDESAELFNDTATDVEAPIKSA